MQRFLSVTCLALLWLGAGCASSPGDRPEEPAIAPGTMVAAIRAAAGDGEGELDVQPLRDPRIEDLRADAVRQEAAGDVAGAVRSLEQALEVVDNDPALLQERAELALLEGDFELAGGLVERAWSLGAQLGPLCRRHWVTLEQLRLRDGDAAGAAAARAQADQCRVAGPERY